MGAISTAFGCSIEGRVPEAEVRRLALAYAQTGADEIGLADTVGYANPRAIRTMVEAVRADVGADLPLRLHLHDTLGVGSPMPMPASRPGSGVSTPRMRAWRLSFAPGARGNIVDRGSRVHAGGRMGFRPASTSSA